LFVQAGTGDSLRPEPASASADPFIFVDPAFPQASLYSIEVSPGVGNADAAGVPEPADAGLVALGILMCAAGLAQSARANRTKGHTHGG